MEIEKRKNIILISLIILLVLSVFYIFIANYFEKHFYFGTTINSIDVSGKTVDETKRIMEDNINDYKLLLRERDNPDEIILGSDIDLKFKNEDKLQNLKKNQSGFRWIFNIGKKDELTIDIIDYDDDRLKSKLRELDVSNTENKTEPQNPTFEYVDGAYKIVDEVKGNIIDDTLLYESVVYAIRDGKSELDLDESNCYVNPQYTSESQEVKDIKDTLDKYVNAKITYDFSKGNEVVDGSIINTWIDINDNYEITVNEKKIKEYLKELSKKYNSVGKTRSFTTTGGSNIKISGGDYGYELSTKDESKYLLEAVTEGKVEEKEIKYVQKPLFKDDDTITNTYVEISIPAQHLWFYKDGSLIVDGPVVTGNVSAGHGTPGGIYKLDDKERNATLKGQGYSSPVSFWMPFNGGIGIHDASWRGSFGGGIYLSSGSHGCVNAPYSLANTIYNNIEIGTPVVCYN